MSTHGRVQLRTPTGSTYEKEHEFDGFGGKEVYSDVSRFPFVRVRVDISACAAGVSHVGWRA